MTTFRINTVVLALALLVLSAPVRAAADQIPAADRDASFLPAPQAPPAAVPQPNAAPAGGATANAPQAVSVPATAKSPVALGAPVESNVLQNIDPESIGLLTSEGGGLGAAMWKNVPRELVDHLLPGVLLPTPSPALNSVAQRFLLTAANVPGGEKEAGQNLISMRVEKLVMLGDAVDAWNLALLAKPSQIDEITLRLVTEAALVSSARKDVCDKLPGIVGTYNSPEWQESLVVCQLQAGNTSAAQLGLEVLHTQDVKDDIFFQLAEHNIIGKGKSLPRQLTPLKPLNLALLLLTNQALPSELYAHPTAAVIPALLQAKARDDTARLSLAERAAAAGIIGNTELTDIYRSITFKLANIANPPGDLEAPRERAFLYQAALNEKAPQKRFGDAEKFMQGLDSATFRGAIAQAAAQMIAGIAPSGDYAAHAVTAARIYMLAGKPDEALGWLKSAKQASAAAPMLTIQLQEAWPLTVLSGLESDADYSHNFGPWLDFALKNADAARREQIGGLLLLFDAAGFAVPEDDWAHVTGPPADERHISPPSALLLERLRMAAAGNRRGEAVLLALALAGTGADQTSLLTAVETARALRLIGLPADSLAFARETAATLLSPPPARP